MENPPDPLPREITSYDLLKTFAVVFMVCDHVGYFFYPHDDWWRVAGRLCVPVWFFLIGYARTRALTWQLWLGAILLEAGRMAAGMEVFPLNVLFTMLVIRVAIDPVMRHALRGWRQAFAMLVILSVLIVPSYPYFEYGTQGLILAMFGYTVRHRAVVQGGRFANTTMLGFMAAAMAGYFIFQEVNFHFTPLQSGVMAAGVVMVALTLYGFRPAVYPRLSRVAPLRVAVQVIGRHTLSIYVGHLLLFSAIGMYLYPHRFALFHWRWMLPA